MSSRDKLANKSPQTGQKEKESPQKLRFQDLGLTADELRLAYQVALETRAHIVSAMLMKSKGEGVEFWIGGPGEEVHGTATALALFKTVMEDEDPGELGYFLHYRNDALAAMHLRLQGNPFFVRDYFRQALSRITDPHSAGRQMVMHLCRPEYGIWPVQSPVGMQLGKAAGFARGFQLLKKKGIAIGIVGDGTTAESDFHEAATAASVWKLPLLTIVTDNEIAISVKPKDGRGIKSYKKYAEAFDLLYFECDGFDFMDTYATTKHAAEAILREGKSAILVAKVARLMGHSSSSGGQFDYDEKDPLLGFASWLSELQLIEEEDRFSRLPFDRTKSYFELHRSKQLESILEKTHQIVHEVKEEPTPSAEAGDHWSHIRPPFPDVEEPLYDDASSTEIQLNEAINRALHRSLSTGKAALWGQDVGHRGGVFKVTHGLIDSFPELVRDAPLNEPLIIGTAMGAALHTELALFPEIQFGDYSLNCLHWFTHMGNVYWSTNGQTPINMTVRMPVDPVLGGALYHSMSVDSFFANVPGLVMTLPSTAYDAYGLLRTAALYHGPVLQLEPKRLYRVKMGPRLPGENEDPKLIRKARRNGDMPEISDYQIPFSKAVKRKSGHDVSIFSWGWASWQSLSAARQIEKEEGISVEVYDLRTLIPYDRSAIMDAARRTGRVLIVQNDRIFAGLGRQIQGEILEEVSGAHVKLIGQAPTPAVAQARILEDAITLQIDDIVDAIRDIAKTSPDSWLKNDRYWLQHAPSRKLF